MNAYDNDVYLLPNVAVLLFLCGIVLSLQFSLFLRLRTLISILSCQKRKKSTELAQINTYQYSLFRKSYEEKLGNKLKARTNLENRKKLT